MSLTNLIKNDDEFKTLFKGIAPRKNEFETMSGKQAFSKEYILKANYELENINNAGLVGTAFDYVARWMIAKHVDNRKEEACSNLIAEDGLYRCQKYLRDSYYEQELESRFNHGIDICKKYVNGSDNLAEVVKVAVFFSRLEYVCRLRLMPWQIDYNQLLACEEEVVQAITQLARVFKESFIDNSIIHKDSDVVYNPTFGTASVLCGGADADIYIDGTIYDFKCTKKFGYAWTDVAQVLGYYLLAEISNQKFDYESELIGRNIKRIALYHARYGEVEFFNIDSLNFLTYQNQLLALLGESEYDDRLKKRKFADFIDDNLEKKLKLLLNYVQAPSNIIKKLNALSANEKENYIKGQIACWQNIRINEQLDGTRILHQMEKHALTINDMVLLTGKSKTTINAWIKGTSRPLAGSLIDLIIAFDCEISDLTKRKENKPMAKKKKGKKRRSWKS